MFRTYKLHPAPPARAESLRQIFSRLEREIAAAPPRSRRVAEPARQRSSLPF